MADTDTIALYRITINVGVPDIREAVTRVKRWILANKTVYDVHGNPVHQERADKRAHQDATKSYFDKR